MNKPPLILIVEDEVSLADTLKDALSIEGYQVLHAPDGKIGLKVASERLPDLIISDVMMPRMDGFQMVQKLKKDTRTDLIPILFLSAKADVNARVKGLNFGVDDYVTKPFVIRELLLKVKNALVIRSNIVKQKLTSPNAVFALSEGETFLNNLKALLEDEIDNCDLALNDISTGLGMSDSSLQKKLKNETGLSVSEYVRKFRLARAMDYLNLGVNNLAHIAEKTGFRSQSYFTTCFKEEYGHPPSHFK